MPREVDQILLTSEVAFCVLASQRLNAHVSAEASEHNSERVGSIEKEVGETSPLRGNKAEPNREEPPDEAVAMEVDQAEEVITIPAHLHFEAQLSYRAGSDFCEHVSVTSLPCLGPA